MTKPEFKYLFDTFFDPLRQYVYYRCTDQETASDIVQDVFMRVWEKHHELDARNLKPLLYKMAHDMMITHWRKQSVKLNFEKDMYVEDEILSPQEDIQFEELKIRYASALAAMPHGQRETFLMSRNDNLKYHEIAERLGISIKTVEKRMTVALRFLKEKLL